MQMEYASSKVVHHALHEIFGSKFRENGFVRTGSGVCSYLKKLDDSYSFAFEVQCSSFGSTSGGNIFCLNAGIGRFTKRADTYGGLYRILRFVDAPRAEAANQLLRNIRTANRNLPLSDLNWQVDHDNWCQYYSAEEVGQWGRFLLPHLPDLISRMLNSEQQAYAGFIPVFAGAAA